MSGKSCSPAEQSGCAKLQLLQQIAAVASKKLFHTAEQLIQMKWPRLTQTSYTWYDHCEQSRYTSITETETWQPVLLESVSFF